MRPAFPALVDYHAIIHAQMGTPVGEGAKKVLPMAFQRIKCVHLESRAPERPGGLANVLL